MQDIIKINQKNLKNYQLQVISQSQTKLPVSCGLQISLVGLDKNST